ncbi:MAG: HEAT repeat domain-containing protein [Clostridiales bacterium]|nr:HEAT repeat domain-containing protein [Clostridiales bacterium]
MAFYELSKEERARKCAGIQNDIFCDLISGAYPSTCRYFDDADTYIRKVAYLGVGRIYKTDAEIRENILLMLEKLMAEKSERIRQTVINSCGEIAMLNFMAVEHLFISGLKDKHHAVKNAVQGSLKKSAEKNPQEVIPFCKKYILDDNPEIRRQVLHGLELRGRTHPEDILPLLRLLQFEKHTRVRSMLIHVMGQISYKKGCLEKVTGELITWEDKMLADACFNEIIKQHRHAYGHFKTVEIIPPAECEEYIIKRRNSI